MKNINSVFGAILLLSFIISCKKNTSDPINIPSPAKTTYESTGPGLTDQVYYDKVLGALVGSAIGDAMGASTEMWHRSDIQKRYGYINGLTPALREKSPEGTWQHNMIAGATTDDTRWKLLVGKYFNQYRGNLSAENFAAFISDYYQSLTQSLSKDDALQSTDVLDEKLEKLDWIKEWARVTIAYQQGNAAYQKAQHRFYGGEMSCAGMLYTPMLGLVAPSTSAAYETAFDHALFDIGYARDISALVSAMTSIAMRTSDMDSILQTHFFVDPYDYKNSRLIGRLAFVAADESVRIVERSKEIRLKDSTSLFIPRGFPGAALDWKRQDYVYRELESRQKAIAFHAGEIWQILFTGLEYGEGDFLNTMTFIVNYGRDNDTVAAVAGMILGAKDGYQQLPKDIREEVLKVNKEVIGIDLEALAKEICSI